MVYRKDKPVPVSGTEGLQFANLAVPSSPRAAQLLEEALPSFDLTIMAPYDPRFLAGWPAEVYEISMSDASLEARRQAVEGVRRSIRAQHGRLDQLSYSASAVQVESFQLVLLPVWYADCRAAGGDFRVVINGASGAAFGQAPGRGLRGWLSDLFSGEG